MTQVELIYNPFSRESRIYIGQRELKQADNRLYEFLQREDFYELLRPFRRRYVIWGGLLCEILEEVNDADTRITFVGQSSDYEKVRDAFEESGERAENLGYGHFWTLLHEADYEVSDMVAGLDDAAESLMELCETAIERLEVQQCRSGCAGEDPKAFCRKLLALIDDHLNKWRESGSPYASSKIGQLAILRETVSGTEAIFR